MFCPMPRIGSLRAECLQVVTGSEDGTIKFWGVPFCFVLFLGSYCCSYADVRSRACTQTLWEPNETNAPDPERWVSCLAVDDADSWLVAGALSLLLRVVS